jgi:hypothetical protein
MVIVIALTPVMQTWADFSVPLLVAGVSVMLIGILLELVDLGKARATIEMETSDIHRVP